MTKTKNQKKELQAMKGAIHTLLRGSLQVHGRDLELHIADSYEHAAKSLVRAGYLEGALEAFYFSRGSFGRAWEVMGHDRSYTAEMKMRVREGMKRTDKYVNRLYKVLNDNWRGLGTR